MCVKKTEKGTKKFTKEEKLSILKEASETSVKAVLDKYDLYPATFYYWKNKQNLSAESQDLGEKKDQLKEIHRLESENKKLKELLAQEKLENALKNDLLKKKVSPPEKVAIARRYIGQGLKRDFVLGLLGMTKHAYYYQSKSGVRGKKPSVDTRQILLEGEIKLWSKSEVVDKIAEIKSNPETDYGYQTMTSALMLLGFIINPKKVYRLMKEYQLLHEKKNKSMRTYVKYRRLDLV